jgi:hypothetical protein
LSGEPEIDSGEPVIVDVATAAPWEPGGSEYVVALRGGLDDRWVETYVLTRRRSPRFSRFHLNRARGRVTFLCREAGQNAPLQEVLEDLKLLVRETNRRAGLPAESPVPGQDELAEAGAENGAESSAEAGEPAEEEARAAHACPDIDPLERFADAVRLALRLLESESDRSEAPGRLAQLLGTAALVFEDGGGEDEAIAALFVAADPNGPSHPERLARIGEKLGDRVAQLVEACDEGHSILTPGGDPRLHSLFFRHTSPALRRIVCASKLRNARTLLSSYRKLDLPERLRFREENDPMLQYYRSLVEAVLEAGQSSHLINDLDGVVLEMELAAGPSFAERRQKRPLDRFTDEVVRKLEARLES